MTTIRLWQNNFCSLNILIQSILFIQLIHRKHLVQALFKPHISTLSLLYQTFSFIPNSLNRRPLIQLTTQSQRPFYCNVHTSPYISKYRFNILNNHSNSDLPCFKHSTRKAFPAFISFIPLNFPCWLRHTVLKFLPTTRLMRRVKLSPLHLYPIPFQLLNL